MIINGVWFVKEFIGHSHKRSSSLHFTDHCYTHTHTHTHTPSRRKLTRSVTVFISLMVTAPNGRLSLPLCSRTVHVPQPQQPWTASRKVATSIPDEVTDVFSRLNLSNRTKILGSSQTLTEKSIENLAWSKEWTASRADNLSAISQPIV
jgi:hypothetical protein